LNRFRTTGAYQPNIGGGDDFIVARFDPDGSMAFCTYLGGSANESLDTHSIVIGADGIPSLRRRPLQLITR
jgi:hypothetical protein